VSTQDPDPTGLWQIVVTDDPTMAGALGYHDLTNDGLPIGYVFAKLDLQAGMSWTVTTSHELLELLGDPDCNLDAQISSTGIRVAYEACDAVEADRYGYEVDGVLLSDFVTPSWFGRGLPGPYDHLNHCDQPLVLLPGGYISVWQPGSGWQQ